MKRNLIVVLSIALLLISGCNKIRSVEDIKGIPVKVTTQGYMFADTYAQTGVISTVNPGEIVEVVAEDVGPEGNLFGWYYQIKRSNGDFGWVHCSHFKTKISTFIGKRGKMGSRMLFTEPVNNPYVDSGEKVMFDLNKSYDEQPVTILQDKWFGIGSQLHWSEIKTKDGETGWTLTTNLYPLGIELKKSISSDRYHDDIWLYNYEKLVKKVDGKNPKWLEKKYGIPMAKVEKLEGEDFGAYIYGNFDVYKKKSSWYFVRFDIKENKVFNVELIGNYKSRGSAWLPLSKFIRGLPFGNAARHFPSINAGISSLITEDGFLDRILPGIIFIPFRIIIIIVILGLSLIFTMLPIAGVTLFVSKRSLNPKVSTHSLVLIQLIFGIVLGHIWFLFLIYHNSFFYNEPFYAVLCLPIIGSLIIAYMVKTLEYNRCPECNYWAGFGLGSIWISSMKHTKTTITDTYQGDTFKGRSVDKKTTIKDKFKDLRACKNCGHEWSIIREETH